eukprot:TRINITY_DN10506_c0_g1_i1.p1 TRINITY_DN10506_c0_g1~~TRINITY_DN10506_c0_g1_i1.p1  ORF type:complete len:960 (-),score=214.54 TRINITY_DN10506_c0_g1_i1:94-2973(-)
MRCPSSFEPPQLARRTPRAPLWALLALAGQAAGDGPYGRSLSSARPYLGETPGDWSGKFAEVTEKKWAEYVASMSLAEELTPDELARYKYRFFVNAEELEQRSATRSGESTISEAGFKGALGGFMKSQAPVLTKKFVEAVNSMQPGWKAELPSWSPDFSVQDAKALLGYIQDPELNYTASDETLEIRQRRMEGLPPAFDTREQWPACAATIGHVRDQGKCGSCWAMATASAMDGRICIGSGGSFSGNHGRLSAGYITSCYNMLIINGCDGGNPSWAMSGMQKSFFSGGAPTSDCVPYFGSGDALSHFDSNGRMLAPSCPHKCSSDYPRNLGADKLYAFGNKHTRDFTQAATSLYAEGPVALGLMVYKDLMSYRSGYYEKTSTERMGGHAVSMIGWTNYNSKVYAIAVNSWGTRWGENGLFKFDPDCCEVTYYVPSVKGQQTALPLPQGVPPAPAPSGGDTSGGEFVPVTSLCKNPDYPYPDKEHKVCFQSQEYATKHKGPCASWCAYDKDTNPCHGCCGPLANKLCDVQKCQDVDHSCMMKAFFGDCDKPATQPWMHENCKVSCKVCQGATRSATPDFLENPMLGKSLEPPGEEEVMVVQELRVAIEVANLTCSALSGEQRFTLLKAVAHAVALALSRPYPLGTIQDTEDNVDRVTLLPCISKEALDPEPEERAGDAEALVDIEDVRKRAAEGLAELRKTGALGLPGMEVKKAADYLMEQCGFLPPPTSSVFAFEVLVSSDVAAANVTQMLEGAYLKDSIVGAVQAAGVAHATLAPSVNRVCLTTETGAAHAALGLPYGETAADADADQGVGWPVTLAAAAVAVGLLAASSAAIWSCSTKSKAPKGKVTRGARLEDKRDINELVSDTEMSSGTEDVHEESEDPRQAEDERDRGGYQELVRTAAAQAPQTEWPQVQADFSSTRNPRSLQLAPAVIATPVAQYGSYSVVSKASPSVYVQHR